MDFSTAWLTTNRTCNNRCRWCYAFNTLGRNSSMDLLTAQHLVDALAERNIKRIILIGGEPTIYSDFIKLVKYIHTKNIRVSVATNGRKFSDLEFSKNVLDAGIDGIDFSLKGLSEEEYFNSTSSYGLEEMLQGYQNLKSLGFTPSVSYVFVNDDYDNLENLISFINSHSISLFSFQFVKPTLGSKQDETSFDLTRMGNFVGQIYKKLCNTSINYCIEISFPLCLVEPSILDKLSKENRIVNCCHVPRGSGINFDENFRIIPCNHFADYPFSDTPVDPLKPSSIEEILSADIVKRFRHLARSYPALKCQSCNLWEQCGGGCFTRWLSLDPNDYIK